MPLPSPSGGENRAEWISRCMSNDTMNQEYPDNDQRLAVCQSIWSDRGSNIMPSLLESIRNRRSKRTEFGYGILTADRWVKTMQEMAGLPVCYSCASKGSTSFDDVLKRAAQTLTYSNADMVVQEKAAIVPDSVQLPKNTLMVFRHVLTTPRLDRDGDILRTEGAELDPRMLLLWQHVHTLPIGKMLATAEHSKDKLSLISCIVDMNEISHDAAVMVDNDMARFSHGFRPLDWEPMKGKEEDEEPMGFDIKRFEVMEESIVSVPSNADAEQQEVLLSLVEGGKLTSPLMKEIGKTIREHRRFVQVPSGWEVESKNLELLNGILVATTMLKQQATEEETDEEETELSAGQIDPNVNVTLEVEGSEDENKPGNGNSEAAERGGETDESAVSSPEETESVEGEAEEEETDQTTQSDVEIETPLAATTTGIEEKTGRRLSAESLALLKECQLDIEELLGKGEAVYGMTRGGVAIVERVHRKLSQLIEAAGNAQAESASAAVSATLEEKEISVREATGIVIANASRYQRQKLLQILKTLEQQADREERAKRFRVIVGPRK